MGRAWESRVKRAETRVKDPIEHISTSPFGMNGMQIIEHNNIAYLNNAILRLTERITKLELQREKNEK